MKKSFKAVLLAAAIVSPAAWADADSKCAAPSGQGITPDQIIEACSSVIHDGGSPLTVSGAYYNRGNAHFDKKEWADAIADFSKALGLRPNYKSAMFNRGLAKKHAGDNAGGDADIAASKSM